jgi:hypothetical protein
MIAGERPHAAGEGDTQGPPGGGRRHAHSLRGSSVTCGRLLVLVSLALVSCGGPEGTYTLDKAETLAAWKQTAMWNPLGFQGVWDATLVLRSGGTWALTTIPGKGTKTYQEGTWTRDRDDITILMPEGVTLTCATTGKKLTCREALLGPKETTYVISI